MSLTITGPGRITLIAEPSGEDDSTKIVVTAKCTDPGVAWITIAELENGDRLGVEMTREGECLTMRLGILLDDNTVDEYLTQPVAQFVAAGDEQVTFDVCWVQGPFIEGIGEGNLGENCGLIPIAVIEDTTTDWLDLDRLLTATEADGDASYSFVAAGSSPALGFFWDFSDIPETAEITGIKVCANHYDGSETDSTIKDVSAGFLGAGALTSDDKATDSLIPFGSPGAIEWGTGEGDTWGMTITGADVRDPEFKFVLIYENVDENERFLGIRYLGMQIWFNDEGGHGPGTLTATAVPVLGIPADGTSGLAMAQARLRWPPL